MFAARLCGQSTALLSRRQPFDDKIDEMMRYMSRASSANDGVSVDGIAKASIDFDAPVRGRRLHEARPPHDVSMMCFAFWFHLSFRRRHYGMDPRIAIFKRHMMRWAVERDAAKCADEKTPSACSHLLFSKSHQADSRRDQLDRHSAWLRLFKEQLRSAAVSSVRTSSFPL